MNIQVVSSLVVKFCGKFACTCFLVTCVCISVRNIHRSRISVSNIMHIFFKTFDFHPQVVFWKSCTNYTFTQTYECLFSCLWQTLFFSFNLSTCCHTHILIFTCFPIFEVGFLMYLWSLYLIEMILTKSTSNLSWMKLSL